MDALGDSEDLQSLINVVWCSYGPGARSAFLIDVDGTVRLAQRWLDSVQLSSAIEDLLNSVRERNQGQVLAISQKRVPLVDASTWSDHSATLKSRMVMQQQLQEQRPRHKDHGSMSWAVLAVAVGFVLGTVGVLTWRTSKIYSTDELHSISELL